MGTLTLPPAGLVCLDTDALIYSVEKIVPYATLLRLQGEAHRNAFFST